MPIGGTYAVAMANGDEIETRVTVERDGHVLLIGLDRPDKRNAADWRMLQELCAAYGELDRDPELRCGLVFAHGDHFTAGLDLADVSGQAVARTSVEVAAPGGHHQLQ
jgi:enoyl-CoA hydratase/carnithine racemase